MADDELAAALERLRAIEQAADHGPWEVTGIGDEDIWSDSKGGFIAETVNSPGSAVFIVTARAAMPRLLAAVEAVLELTRDGDGDDLYPSIELTVGDVREAITRELTGKEASDGR